VLQVAGLVLLFVGAVRVFAPYAPAGELVTVVLLELEVLVAGFPEIGPVSYVVAGLAVSMVGLAGSMRASRVPAVV